jgi:hypothetical protein
MAFPPGGGPIRPPAHTPAAEELAAVSARHFGTTPEILLPLHSWFLETANWFDDERHYAMRNHSFGIFQAEQYWGVVLGQGTAHPVPTRVVGEWHVRTVMCGAGVHWLCDCRRSPCVLVLRHLLNSFLPMSVPAPLRGAELCG